MGRSCYANHFDDLNDQAVRISWSIPKALDKGFQRILRSRSVPQGNNDWYKMHPSLASCRRTPLPNP
jgi:hypothetical protein